jgi:hypothetical protein
VNYFPRLASKHDPPDLYFLNNWDYRHEPRVPNFFPPFSNLEEKSFGQSLLYKTLPHPEAFPFPFNFLSKNPFPYPPYVLFSTCLFVLICKFLDLGPIFL